MSIVVLGACFLDYIGYVERLPAAGETIAAKQFVKGFGGKGANQAVMAGRLGSPVTMVSVVGNDGDGDAYIENFRANGIDSTYVRKVPEQSTGLAMIAVSDRGENDIVICRNATDALTPQYIATTFGADLPFLKGCKVLVTQNELPLETTLHVLKKAAERGILTIFNSAPAPSRSEIRQVLEYAKYVSIFCPNETEAELITGTKVKDLSSGAKAISQLHRSGIQKVVLTLGDKGCLVSENIKSVPVHLAALKVRAVDTTGAGDCFVGSMVHFMIAGDSLLEACRKANICAAYSVQRKGTQTSFPRKGDISDAEFAAPSNDSKTSKNSRGAKKSKL